ncbi:MAG: hypothetical protein KBA33_00290 [Cloacibacterium sp.]|nr:hypothetical protein [Cloacibacterium sp.]
MKKLILMAGAATLTLTACKKEEKKVEETTETKVEVVKDSTGTTVDSTKVTKTEVKDGNLGTQKHSYTYKSTDNKDVQVTFTTTTDNKKNTILIEREGVKIELPQKEAWAKGAIYEKDGISAKSSGDKIELTQGGKVIEMSRK